MMGFRWDLDMLNTDCLETWQDLCLWPSASNTAPKCPGGVRVKNHCVGLRPAPPLAEARVTPATASFRDITTVMQVLHLQPFVPQLRLPPRLVVYLQNSPGESHSNWLQRTPTWLLLGDSSGKRNWSWNVATHLIYYIYYYLTFILGNYLRSSQGTWETSWGWLNSNEPMKKASEEFWRRAFLWPTNKKLSKEEHGSCSKKLSNDQGYSCQPVHKRANSPWHLCELFTFLWEHCMCECCMCIENHWDIANMVRIGAVPAYGICLAGLPEASADPANQRDWATLWASIVASSRVKSRSPAMSSIFWTLLLHVATGCGPARSPNMCRSATQWFPTGFPQIDEPVESQCLTVSYSGCPYNVHMMFINDAPIWCSLWASCQLTGSLMASGRLSVSVRMSQAACSRCSRCSRCSCSTASGHPKSHAMWLKRGASLKRDWWDWLKKQVNHVPEKWWKMDIDCDIHRHSNNHQDVLSSSPGSPGSSPSSPSSLGSLGLNSASAPVAVAGLSSWHV